MFAATIDDRNNADSGSSLPGVTASISMFAWRHQVGDISCTCGVVGCDGLAGHDNWDGKEYYRGLNF